MTLLERLNKPQYVFRPRQLWKACVERRDANEWADVRLPWGPILRVRKDDDIGRAIERLGIHELNVSEALWRLCDAGDLAVDAGANIGQMTSLLAHRCGATGRVISFEPHPQLYRELVHNVSRWSPVAAIELHEVALSQACCAAHIAEPPGFARNRGTAKLRAAEDGSVRVQPLDNVLGPDAAAGVLKVDVEGHEHDVLKGSQSLLGRHAIRDIVFEDFDLQPSICTQLLAAHGYRVWKLGRTLFGPLLLDVTERTRTLSWEAPNFLATCDPDRAAKRLAPRGWQVLRGKQ